MEQTKADLAAERLQDECGKIVEKTLKDQRDYELWKLQSFAPVISQMLIKFCYQDERFAQAALAKDKTLKECVEGIVKELSRKNPMKSDAQMYAEAVEYYIPEGRVSVSIRIDIPEQQDEDLLAFGGFLGSRTSKTEEDKRAIVLDLIGGEA